VDGAMSFEPTAEELQVFTVLQSRLREQFADTLGRRISEIVTEAAARGIMGGYVESQRNQAAAAGLEKYASDLMWALLERFGAIYGALTPEMIDWIDARVEEATVLQQKDEATRSAYLRAKQLRAIELGTLRAKISRAAGRSTSSAPADVADGYDLFICHAFEDKERVAAPLAQRLRQTYRVWYDDFALTIGDSLREKIERGLSTSRYGVVILSPRFFAKRWPMTELAALFARQNALGRKVILPVWVELSHEDVTREALLLADLMAARWDDGIDKVVEQLSTVLDITQ
jgi:hypothetical protein